MLVANDVLRFTLELPDGPGYTSSVAHVERAMADRGYESIQVKNFWARGNRFYGVNWTLRTPSGHPFEVQLSTQLSLRADSMTHEVYEILRRRDELEARRVHALLWMLSVNNELELPQAIPPGLATAHRPRDNGLPAWIARNPNEWDDYVVWLNENVRGLRGILAEFNLSIADFPVSSRRAKTMREGDLGLLRDL